MCAWTAKEAPTGAEAQALLMTDIRRLLADISSTVATRRTLFSEKPEIMGG